MTWAMPFSMPEETESFSPSHVPRARRRVRSRTWYLTDIAMEWLDEAIRGLGTMSVFSVHGVCEPGRMICTVSYWNCHVIFEGEERNNFCEGTEHAHVCMLDFCRALHADISANLDAWVCWDEYYVNNPHPQYILALKKRREDLQERLDLLYDLIDQQERNFGSNRYIF